MVLYPSRPLEECEAEARNVVLLGREETMSTRNFNVGDQVQVKPLVDGRADRQAEGYPGVVLEVTERGEFRVSHMYSGVTELVAAGQLFEAE